VSKRYFRHVLTQDTLAIFKLQTLQWVADFPHVAYLDSNAYAPMRQRYELIVAVGKSDTPTFQYQRHSDTDPFAALHLFHKQQTAQGNGWLFGHLSYDLKNVVEPSLRSDLPDALGFPLVHFFSPTILIAVTPDGVLTIQCFEIGENAPDVFEKINSIEPAPTLEQAPFDDLSLKATFSRSEFIQTVETVRQHIAQGDMFEMNLCQHFYQTDITLPIVPTFQRLNALTQMPFAAYYRLHERHLLCASPERYLQKTGQQLRSEPIKGTAKRGKTDAEDSIICQTLEADEKNRAENIMIVDLVRNDLGRAAVVGSVEVTELCKVYTFRHVHQMISTVVATLRPDATFTDALRATFPMGSMTGAPKVRALRRIEQYERTQRGLYSGSVGYITPTGDFDFNVVIRSILYEAEKKYLSFQVGGAITFASDAEAEYEECMTKAVGILTALGGRIVQ
jgi:para-aminobenzoate synthetase component I